MVRAWLVRAGRFGEREQWALTNGVSGGGFHEVPDLTSRTTREAVVSTVLGALTGEKDAAITNFAAQLWALRDRMSVGDLVVMPLKSAPQIAIGRITGDYTWRDDADPSLSHVRPVEWLVSDIARTTVKQDLLYSLGAFLTVCEIKRNDAVTRLTALSQGKPDPGASAVLPVVTKDPVGSGGAPQATTDENALMDEAAAGIDIAQYAFDRLSSHVIEVFAGHRMQDLVAAILESEGFVCTVFPPGPDGGVDVLAAKGPLGLDDPRLVVQVKSQSSPVGAPVVQQLLGAMSGHQATQGLLVAWGGTTKQAQQLLVNQHFRVQVWGPQELLGALIRNYPSLPEEIRSSVPLKPVWVLAEQAG